MPALADRDQFESTIVLTLAPIFRDQYERAIAAAAHSPNAIPYAQFQADLYHAMSEQLFRVFTAAGYALIIGQTLVVSAGSFEESARRWSQGMAREIAESVVATSQRMTSDLVVISRGERGGYDPQRFNEGLSLVYLSPSRLNAIAITETTRATSAAEHAVVFFFRQDKTSRLVAVWICVEESPGVPAESVCEICAPFDRRTREVWGREFPMGSPAHVGCRCHQEWWEVEEWARRAA